MVHVLSLRWIFFIKFFTGFKPRKLLRKPMIFSLDFNRNFGQNSSLGAQQDLCCTLLHCDGPQRSFPAYEEDKLLNSFCGWDDCDDCGFVGKRASHFYVSICQQYMDHTYLYICIALCTELHCPGPIFGSRQRPFRTGKCQSKTGARAQTCVVDLSKGCLYIDHIGYYIGIIPIDRLSAVSRSFAY